MPCRRFDKNFKARFGFLYARFQKHVFWWDLLVIARTTCVIIVRLLLPAIRTKRESNNPFCRSGAVIYDDQSTLFTRDDVKLTQLIRFFISYGILVMAY